MIDLIIRCNDLIKTFGTADALKVGLFDGSTPLNNYPLQIIINGRTYNKITGSDGYTSLNINLPVGEYETTVKYNGNATYNPQTKSVVVKVLSNITQQTASKKQGNYFEVNTIPLIVKLSDGFSVTPGISIKETDMLMQTATMNAPTFYFNQGDHGTEFDISVMMRASYRYGDYTVADYLDMWYKNLTPVSVVTDALDVPNSKYIMTVKSKKQSNHGFSIWKLHFHQYYENNQSFERMYSEKTSTLSADDLELLRYTSIDANSPQSAILSLQRKLHSWGYFSPTKEVNKWIVKREPNGVWDEQMLWDLHNFQCDIIGNTQLQGKCERNTINALIGNDGRINPNSNIIRWQYNDWVGLP